MDRRADAPEIVVITGASVGVGLIARGREVFDRALTADSDLGLFSEEYNADNLELLGNFPQSFSRLSYITAALADARRDG